MAFSQSLLRTSASYANKIAAQQKVAVAPAGQKTAFAASTGVAAPQQVAASNQPNYYTGLVGGKTDWYNPQGYSASNPLASINPVSGLKYYEPTKTMTLGATGDGGGDAGGGWNEAPGYYANPNNLGGIHFQPLDPKKTIVPGGNDRAYPSLDPNGQYFSYDYSDPKGGPNGKDKVRAIYQYDAATGTAKPVSAAHEYQPGYWVEWGRDAAKIAGAVALAGVGGAALASSGTVAGGTAGATVTGGGLSSADLAALYGANGYGATLTSAQITAYDAAIASGATAAEAASSAGVSQLASSAPAYSGVGTSGAGAGTDAVVNGSAASSAGGATASTGLSSTAQQQLIKTAAGLLIDKATGQQVSKPSPGAVVYSPTGQVISGQVQSGQQNALSYGATGTANSGGGYDIAPAQAIRDLSTGDYISTYRPVEQKLAQDAMDVDSQANQDAAAGRAGTDVQRQVEQQRAATDRNLTSMGVNPNSGRFVGQSRADDVRAAAARVGAEQAARTSLVTQGVQQRSNVAQLGATKQNTALSADQTAQAGYKSNDSTNLGYADLNESARKTNVNADLAQQDINNKTSLQQSQGYGALLSLAGSSGVGQAVTGAIGSAASSAYDWAKDYDWGSLLSDEDAKTDKAATDSDADLGAVRKMRVEKWRYKADTGLPGEEQQGTYAQDFKKHTGMGDGKSIPIAAALGVTMNAIKALDRKVSRGARA